MTFKTFDELDAEAGPASLFADYAKKPTVTATEGYDTPETIAKAKEIAQRSTIAAAFRQDNTVVSILSREDTGVDNKDDGQFDPVAYVKEHNLQGYEDSFMGVMNGRRADAVRSQIKTELRDKETLDASGWAGTFAQIAAGVFDAPTLIPGVVAVRGAKGTYSVGRSVLMGGASAGATQAATEGFLQATQETRTAADSAINVGAAAVLGSLLGGGVAAVLGKNARVSAERAIDNLADIQSGAKPNEFVPDHVLAERGGFGGGADVADGAFYVDPIQKARTRDELAVERAAANFVVEKTAWFNPVLRATQRYAASARQAGNVLYENTIYRAMHSAGDTTGVSVEAAVRARVSGAQAEAVEAAGLAYKEMRASGVRLSKDDFYGAVGRAMRNNDKDENPFVERAAQGYRKMFDEFTKDALKLNLLDEGDLDVKTAASYFSRVYNRDRLLAAEPDFLETIGKHFADRMAQAYEIEGAAVKADRAKYRQRTDDLNLSGPERSKRIDDIGAEGRALDKDNAHLEKLIDDLSEARGRLRKGDDAAKGAAREEVKRLLETGGEELQAYLAKRAELRARMRNLSERNPDAQAARAEKLDERVDRLEDQVAKSLTAFARQAKNILNKAAADPVAKAEDALAQLEKQLAEVSASLDEAAQRANKLAAQYAEGADPQTAFVQAAERAAAEGRGDAIRVGTREADRVTAQVKAGQRAVEQYERYGQRLGALQARLEARELKVGDAQKFMAEFEALLQDVTNDAAQRQIRSGERMARLKERAAKLTPEQIKTRADAQGAQFARVLGTSEARFDSKWGPRRALGAERGEAFDFEAAGRATAKEIYDKITGKVQQRDDLPAFITKITSGPMKDRTFMVPDELLQGKGWLLDDVRTVADRYARSMAGEIELTRRFGRADMTDQLGQIAQEYSDLRVAAGKATTVDELNAVLGRDKYGARTSIDKAKLDAQQVLAQDEASAITDTKAGRDLIRGTYNQGVNNSNFASVTRSLMHFNYVTRMGGILLSNLTELYRPAMVHGIVPYLNTLPQALAQIAGKGNEGFRASLREANLAGLVRERVLHSIVTSNGDIADPFLTKTTQIERFMQKATGLASRWNFVNVFTDAQQAIASALSQHRVLEAVLGNGGKDGSFTKGGDGIRLIRMLGMDERTQADVARLFQAHGETVDGIRVANTERWLTEGGTPEQIARNENAVRVYRAVINTDVNSIVSRRGLGDAPLFAHHPVGRMMTQFSGYAMGAHSRVMIRGLQESHARLIGGITAMSLIGAGTAWMASWRSGRETHEKRMKDWERNPAMLIGEGLDRSGFFPLLFDFSGRVEKASTSIGYNYRFNPVKSSVNKAAGGNFFADTPSTRSSEAAGLLSAVGGPSVGMLESVPAAGRVLAARAEGREPTKRDVNQALAVVPYQSYYGMRELLQVINGNSAYTR